MTRKVRRLTLSFGGAKLSQTNYKLVESYIVQENRRNERHVNVVVRNKGRVHT